MKKKSLKTVVKKPFKVTQYDYNGIPHFYRHKTFEEARKQIKGLNLSMETVDAPVNKITLHKNEKLLYSQEKGEE